jgi:hypothetical protein
LPSVPLTASAFPFNAYFRALSLQLSLLACYLAIYA